MDGETEDVRRKISISGTSKGLGIRIVGGRTVKLSDKESHFGIFIKEVIRASLAEKDGNLRKGDQILEVNGTSLVGVSNEIAVEVLKKSATTDHITFIISRDSKSQQDFRRLSNSVLKPSTESLPVATSTPRGAQPEEDFGARQNGDSEGNAFNEDEAKRLSTSSELTQVSTTDISSHGDELENEMIDRVTLNKNLQEVGSGVHSPNSVALSDVVLEEASLSRRGEMAEASLGYPPPIPTSPPPSLEPEDEPQLKAQKWRSRQIPAHALPDHLRGRSSPEGKSMSPPPSAGMSTLTTCHTFIIPKTAGLGVIIGGGQGRPDGPYIKIEKVLDGMDAAKDGNLQSGDRIISVNGEDLRNVKREKALTSLTRMKADQNVTTYNLTIERDPGQGGVGLVADIVPPASLPSPQRDTSASIFNSDTLLASDFSKPKVAKADESFTSDSVSPTRKSTPLRYLAKRDSERRRVKQDSMHRLSMDPNARCKLSKLEWALKYMGYNMTPQQQKHMHSSLDIDENGKVVFTEFVKLAQEMFAFKLEDSLQADLMLALTRKEDLDMPPMPKKATSYEQLWDLSMMKESLIKPASSQPVLPPASSTNSIHSDEELEQMRRKLHTMGYQREKDKMLSESARQELEKERQITARLKRELKQKEEELRRMKDRSTISEEDEEILIKRISMTEDAHKIERDKANKLEDELRKLKAEVVVYRDHQPKMNLEELRKRLAVIDNEWNKEKVASRRYQVAVEKLMQFVENCHEVLVKSPEVDRILYHPHGKGASVQRGTVVTGNPRPPQYLSRHAKLTATSLAKEAQETIAAVRKMMETDELPFGWQEAYTEEGVKYYINHETQMTSWVHPVTKMTASSRSSSQASLPSIPSGHATATPTPSHQ